MITNYLLQNNKLNKVFINTLVFTTIIFILTVILSWIISAFMPETSIRAILSKEGLRWFFCKLPQMLVSPTLLFLVLLGFTFGVIKESKIIGGVKSFFYHKKIPYRIRFALNVVFVEIVLFFVIIFILVFSPHAIFLSIDGSVWGNTLWYGIFPIMVLSIMIFTLSYSVFAGTLNSAAKIVKAFCNGISYISPIIVFYICVASLINTLLYVFG